MPIHDWTRVPANLFHDFHQTWTIRICDALNGGLLPRDYALVLQKLITNFSHEGRPPLEEDLELISNSEQGVDLIALVDRRNHHIKKAGFAGQLPTEQRRLAELLCRTIEGKPIQDASDHALIDMEYALFGRERRRGAGGIVMPENVSSAFELPARLIRGLMRGYRARTGYQEIRNYHDAAASPQWRRLAEGDRIAQIQQAIDEHPAGGKVKVVRLEGLQRFIVEFDDSVPAATSCLLNLEKWVKDKVEPTLQLYLQPQPDQNKLRRLNDRSVQADGRKELG